MLANDGDPATLDATSLSIVAAPTMGAVEIVDGSVRYTPNADQHGVDGFVCSVCTPSGESATGQVEVTVHPVNDRPVATADVSTTDEGSVAVVDVLANDTDVDGDRLAVRIVGGPRHGDVDVDQNGIVTFTPTDGWCGEDTFSYVASDGVLAPARRRSRSSPRASTGRRSSPTTRRRHPRTRP